MAYAMYLYSRRELIKRFSNNWFYDEILIFI